MSHTVRPTAGWYADPKDSGTLRWWTGTHWSEHTQSMPSAPVLAEEPVVVASVTDQISVSSEVPAVPPTVVPPPVVPSVATAASDGSSSDGDTSGGRNVGHRGRSVLFILVLVLIVAVALAAGAWYLWSKPDASAGQVAASGADPVAPAPAVPAEATVPGACSDVVAALTADGTSTQLVAQLQTSATGVELADTASFLATIGPVTSDLLANSGAACVAAVNSGQGPAAYATFVNSFNSATASATQIVNAGLSQPDGLTVEQKAELTRQAAELDAATAAVVKDAPPVPAGPPAG